MLLLPAQQAARRASALAVRKALHALSALRRYSSSRRRHHWCHHSRHPQAHNSMVRRLQAEGQLASWADGGQPAAISHTTCGCTGCCTDCGNCAQRLRTQIEQQNPAVFRDQAAKHKVMLFQAMYAWTTNKAASALDTYVPSLSLLFCVSWQNTALANRSLCCSFAPHARCMSRHERCAICQDSSGSVHWAAHVATLLQRLCTNVQVHGCFCSLA